MPVRDCSGSVDHCLGGAVLREASQALPSDTLQDAQVTDARGPDFLPYVLPDRPVAPTQVLNAPAPAKSGRWQQALTGLTPWGRAALTAGLTALAVLLLLSIATGHREAGAWFASLAAVTAAAAGLRALKDEQSADSLTLVKGGMATGLVSAVLALLVLLTHSSSVADQPPVQVPSPQPTSAPTTPQPQQPTPSATPLPQSTPSFGVLPPGSSDLFGLPTQPDPPTTQSSTAKGLLTGRVVTTSGAGLEGATVTITRSDPADVSDSPQCPLKVTTTTNAKGVYKVALCQLGDQLGYHVVISSGTASANTDLFVNAGQTTVYNAILAVRHA